MSNHLENVELACTKAATKLAHARARIAQADSTNAMAEIVAAEDALAIAKHDLNKFALEFKAAMNAERIRNEFFQRHKEDY